MLVRGRKRLEGLSNIQEADLAGDHKPTVEMARGNELQRLCELFVCVRCEATTGNTENGSVSKAVE